MGVFFWFVFFHGEENEQWEKEVLAETIELYQDHH